MNLKFETSISALDAGLPIPALGCALRGDVLIAVPEGIYAAEIMYRESHHKALVIYGTDPTFPELGKILAVKMYDAYDSYFGPHEPITIELIKLIRSLEHYSSPELWTLERSHDDDTIMKLFKIV